MRRCLLALVLVQWMGCGRGCAGPAGNPAPDDAGVVVGSTRPDGGGSKAAELCAAGATSGPVRSPAFRFNIPASTGWFGPPSVVDLDGDGTQEIVAAGYDLFVYRADGSQLARGEPAGVRTFAPAVIGDLEGDGSLEIVTGQGRHVYAYRWDGSGLQLRPGFPVDTTAGGGTPEIRGLAAADLGRSGRLQIIATTTQTTATSEGGAQVFVLEADGSAYHPSSRSTPDWPRYNALEGTGNDADRNGMGHSGYGGFGLNPGVGQLDDDDALEVVVSFDNHFLQVFDHDGVAEQTAPHFTNPLSAHLGERLTWGQLVRWADPAVETALYHDHRGGFPTAETHERLQWTQSPPSVVDLDGDGQAEVVAVANVEKGSPYQTVAWALMVLEGAQGDGTRSAMRKPGWETPPRGETPIPISGYYPPISNPAPAIANLSGDARPEIVVSLNDGYLSAYSADATRLWRVDVRHGKSVMYAAEPTVADLNQDGLPEVVVVTYGAPTAPGSGNLMVLSHQGQLLHDLALPGQRTNGNGIGAAAAPSLADLDGDGSLEILVHTFDHGIDVFTVPGSGTLCRPWPTARGGLLRQGRAL